MSDKSVKRWTMPDHYAGAQWPEYFSSGFGQSRDSDCLEESNFATALEALGGESDTVRVVRESHWAVGWVEWIAIHESNTAAIAKAQELCERYNQYPALNEDDWSEREQEAANSVWADCFSWKERIAYMRKFKSQFEFHDWRDMLHCARGQYFAGYASELLS